MIIAIDETGSFIPNTNELNFFTGVLITAPLEKEQQFLHWENSIPRKFKNSKGEIKGGTLSIDHLTSFFQEVIITMPYVPIFPVSLITKENSEEMVNNWKMKYLKQFAKGAGFYKSQGSEKLSVKYYENGNWLNNLNYQKFLKLQLLGECIASSLEKTMSYSIIYDFDERLIDLRFEIDRDFIKTGDSNIFWKEILRNQLYRYSIRHPFPILEDWIKNDHSFLKKYRFNGDLDFNKLFWENCKFVDSKDSCSVRIADIVCSIISRFYNRHEAIPFWDTMNKLIPKSGIRRIQFLESLEKPDNIENPFTDKTKYKFK